MKRLHAFAGHPVPEGLELYVLSERLGAPSCHVYMEAQVFTPDSQRLILHRSAHPHGSDPEDPEHAYFLCDFADGGRLSPLADERGVTAPCVSPDGRHLYYCIRGGLTACDGRITLMRVGLDGTGRETVAVVDNGTAAAQPAAPMYPLSTIASDGRRVALASALAHAPGDPCPEHALWVIDTRTGAVDVPLRGRHFCNLHMQYCRSQDAPRDIMIQHNHGSCSPAVGGQHITHVAARDPESGCALRAVPASRDPRDNHTGYGVDLHVIRDDGTAWRTFPWGRDGIECCQGHQCWRGDSRWGIASTLRYQTPVTAVQELVESMPLPDAGHNGLLTPGAVRNRLSAGIAPPHFLHFATDARGTRIISDYEAESGEWHLYEGSLAAPGAGPAALRCLLNLGPRAASPWHPHPFLSPDGTMAFFNASPDGLLQAYALRLTDG